MKKYRQIHEHYLKEDEGFLIKDIMPDYYIDQNIGRNLVDVEYAVRFLQNSLNNLLSSFLNGGFSSRGYALYPFVKDVSGKNLTGIKRLRKIAIFLNNNGYDFSNSIEKYKDSINSRDFASILSALYLDSSLIKNHNIKIIKKLKCEELDTSSYKKPDLKYLKPLAELKRYADENLKQNLSGFYLHGSLATKDYIKGWSDVDTLAIVSKEALGDPNALLDLRDKFYFMRHFFYKIDPLQHHGCAVISDHDLQKYCQAYFPVEVFKYAKSFFKDDNISNLYARGFSSEALKNLFWFVSYFRKLNEKPELASGSYGIKTMLHYVTLFPALYLQAKGMPMYKKFSFSIAKKDFKKEAWRVIDNASSIRLKWKCRGTLALVELFSKTNPLLYYRLNASITDIFWDAKKENRINIDSMAKSMFSLSEEAWNNIKKNAHKKL